MTSRSSSTCSDDSRIRPEPVTAGVRVRPVRVLTRSAPPSGTWAERPPGTASGAPREAASTFAHEAVPEAAPGSGYGYGSEYGEDDRYDDPLLGLVRTAVATRPLEDVVRLIALLESSPEHTRTLAEAVRSAGVDRSVADVTRLAVLLTRPPRTPAGADAVLRAAAGLRPVAEVGPLLRLLHRTPLEPRCRRTAVQAAATGRTVGELTELIGELAADAGAGADRPVRELAPAAPEGGAPVAEGPSHAHPPGASPRRAPRLKLLRLDPAVQKPPPKKAALHVPAGTGVRVAALLVFLCGAAHAPRYWAGLSHGLLGATLVASALCMLLGLALPARAVHARLGAAAAALAVTAGLGAGQVLGGRFGLPDPARLWAATLAPPWLAGTAAAVAALGALAVVLAVLLGVNVPGRRGS
ncbi:hypothetical protein [Streptomyces sp. WP-1]|uniref:hypothetical protein n=1 Tax=Streptomyces sp. WP-1 TaxID=3041497 RepID=UPI0026471898|nr:hypothetical protein [Streptomyces sp. WP-1]WKE73376.1 hypothetical protein QHG49_32410 [Streptomyces sp. WP-1]